MLIGDSDVDGDGTIDFNEFMRMMTFKARQADWEREIRQAFRVFDKVRPALCYRCCQHW